MKYFKKGNFIIVKDASDQEKNSFNLATINRVEIDDISLKIKFGDGELNFSNFISFTLEDGTIKLKADFPNFSDLKTWALSNFFFVAKSGGGADSGGSVTNVSITSSNGITSSITDNSTTPKITLGLGNITPNSVNSTGSITGSNLSGTNTGDETKSSIEEKLGVAIVNVIDEEGDLSAQVPTVQAFDDAITPVITNLEQQINSKANQSTTYTKTEVDNALDLKEDNASKNVAGGYVGLDSNSLIAIPQILPSRFIAAGTNITLNENDTTKIVTISSTGGGLPPDTLFSFRERIGGINWTINGGSNTFFNFTDEFFTQAIVDEDFNFLTGANPYFIYNSAGQKLLMRSNLINQRIKFKITLRVSYNGGGGSEFAFVLGRPFLTTNNSVTNTIGVQKATQGQNIQSTQVIKHELTLFTTLLPTTGGTDPFQTEGFKLGFFNYSTSTSITITDAQLVIEQIN